MSVSREELLDWLWTLPKETVIAIDDGGLILVAIGEDAYYEVGGFLEEADGPEPVDENPTDITLYRQKGIPNDQDQEE